MEKIASFTVNHLKLKSGLYVSRRDSKDGITLTTFDMRITAPNIEPVMDTGAIHTIEHLGATYLRNSSEKDNIVYFGPMGCRTGFYIIMFGNLNPHDIFPLVTDMCRFIIDFKGNIPGASPKECGNFSEQNLDTAIFFINRYLNDLEENKRFVYPE